MMSEQDNSAEALLPFIEPREVRDFLVEIQIASSGFQDVLNDFSEKIRDDKNLKEIIAKYIMAREDGVEFPPVMVERFEKTIESLKIKADEQDDASKSAEQSKPVPDRSANSATGNTLSPASAVGPNERMQVAMSDPVTASAAALGGAIGGMLNFTKRGVQALRGKPSVPADVAFDHLKGALNSPVKDWNPPLIAKSMASLKHDLDSGGTFSKDEAVQEEIKQTLTDLHDKADDAIRADPNEKERLKEMMDLCQRLVEMVTRMLSRITQPRGARP